LIPIPADTCYYVRRNAERNVDLVSALGVSRRVEGSPGPPGTRAYLLRVASRSQD